MDRFRCKHQYKKEGNPFVLCDLFEEEEVICGSYEYEELCSDYEPIEGVENEDSSNDSGISDRNSN